MNVGIIGIGAIGSVIAHCVESKHETYYFNRSNKSKIEIRKGGKIYSQNIVLSNAEVITSLDWLIVCLKEYHYTAAHDLLRSLITSETKVAVIRNGINLKESLLQYTVAENVIECIIDCPTQIQSDGAYHQLYKPIVKVRRGGLAPLFRNLFQPEEIEITEVDNYHTASWMKLIESSALGSLLCLSGETCRIFENEKLVSLYERVIAEGILVAIAEGANIDSEFKSDLIQKLKTYPPNKSSSMLSDRKNGRPIEVNAKNGIISKFGKSHNIKTDLNDMLSSILSCINLPL